MVEIVVPPLRDRRSDIPILIEAFLSRRKGPRRAVSEEALQRLSNYRWPGNVRELMHALERACVMSAADVLDSSDFDVLGGVEGRFLGDDELDLRGATTKLERDLILRALQRTGGNRTEAARLLGIARPQLYAKMKELAISASNRIKL